MNRDYEKCTEDLTFIQCFIAASKLLDVKEVKTDIFEFELALNRIDRYLDRNALDFQNNPTLSHMINNKLNYHSCFLNCIVNLDENYLILDDNKVIICLDDNTAQDILNIKLEKLNISKEIIFEITKRFYNITNEIYYSLGYDAGDILEIKKDNELIVGSLMSIKIYKGFIEYDICNVENYNCFKIILDKETNHFMHGIKVNKKTDVLTFAKKTE